MVLCIITLLLGIVPFIMFTQPLFWAYSGDFKDLANKIYQNTSCYQGIMFKEGQDTYYTVGCVFLIIAMVMAGLMLLFTLLQLICRATGNTKKLIGVRIFAVLFFLTMLVSVIMFAVFMINFTGAETIEESTASTVGYGLLTALGASFLSIFFAPKKKV